MWPLSYVLSSSSRKSSVSDEAALDLVKTLTAQPSGDSCDPSDP